jgi:predicted CoA-binding protein
VDASFLVDDDQGLRELLRGVRTIAIVGASSDPGRASHGVAAYLEHAGYEVLRVNPNEPGMYADLAAIGRPVDLVDLFRRSDQVGPHVDEAIATGARAIWMQLGVVDQAAARRAHQAGLKVVMDRCSKVEHRRLLGR